MKTRTDMPLDFSSWQTELGESLRNAQDLLAEGLIEADEVPRYEALLLRYRFALPRYYASLIDKKDPRCPIRLQALPSLLELEDTPGKADPLDDSAHRPAPRITHRYRNRVLLHLTPNCSMYCRFCFRKTLLNDLRDTLFTGELEATLRYLSDNREIEEVIFSGGDPLLANEETLDSVLENITGMKHIERVRFHTRVPVTLPSRITADWVARVSRHQFPVVVVVHFNHPREVTPQSTQACRNLRDGAITLLNQSVLLRGVNDSSEILAHLSKKLFAIGVLPYYLHHPDPAQGTAHFAVSVEQGRRIFHELRARLSGYLVPRYVQDDLRFPYKRYAIET